MEVLFTTKLEEYYQKFVDLQEKLKKSEEQRFLLEMKFNDLVQVAKEEEQAHYKKLRAQYKRFLEEDKKRQERNERIIRNLERIETRISMLSAKTERINMLRRQYQQFLSRIAQPTNVTRERSFVKEEPQKTLFREEYKEPDASKKHCEEKMEILDRYLQTVSSQKCRDTIEQESGKRVLANQVSTTNDATAIAEDIMDSIYSRYYRKEADLGKKLKEMEKERVDLNSSKESSEAELLKPKELLSKEATEESAPAAESEKETNVDVEPQKSEEPLLSIETMEDNKQKIVEEEEAKETASVLQEQVNQPEELSIKEVVAQENQREEEPPVAHQATQEEPVAQQTAQEEAMAPQQTQQQSPQYHSEQPQYQQVHQQSYLEQNAWVDQYGNPQYAQPTAYPSSQYQQYQNIQPVQYVPQNNRIRQNFRKFVRYVVQNQRQTAVVLSQMPQGSQETYQQVPPDMERQGSQEIFQGSPEVTYVQEVPYDQTPEPLYPEESPQQYVEDPHQTYDPNQSELPGYDEYGQMIFYDQHGQVVEPQYDENGHIVPQYDQNGQMVMIYDHNGQACFSQEETYATDGQYGGNGQQIMYEYEGQAEYYGEVAQEEPKEEAAVVEPEKVGISELLEEEKVEEEKEKVDKVLEILDTDTEQSTKQNSSKISNDTDFDFS
ncbi:uncharacterized protein LOC126746834 [Anthonomus grandis grandis]|uniref:uncharacterized protein LOC126746834 n=1 Tax=Anthonomus grandis grandis TaxID=2921223 RepID=UPI002165AE08|nr:uncharacterized protein LOC126746834 [Anthonomus grandis grandis]